MASDCDAPEAPLIDLVSENMVGASMLPFVLFADSDGQWINGISGAISPAQLQKQLESMVS
ncbi:MAG: hypothetical protein ACI9EF_001415 [Pseudohongiellaceae bacterium]